MKRRPHSPWTKEAITEVVRRIAITGGFDFETGWMRIADYAELRAPDDPAPATISANHLWSDIMSAAGFDPRNATRRGPRGGGTQRKAFTDAELKSAVAEYVDSRPTKMSAAGMDIFLASREDLPSGATIRNHFRRLGFGSLNQIIAEAMREE